MNSGSGPFREKPRAQDGRDAGVPDEPRVVWEGPLYPIWSAIWSKVKEETDRVRVVERLEQRGGGVDAHLVHARYVEVTISRNAMGDRVWLPAKDLGSGYSSVTIEALSACAQG